MDIVIKKSIKTLQQKKNLINNRSLFFFNIIYLKSIPLFKIEHINVFRYSIQSHINNK